ncbi:hypothetical protein Pcaca05_32410 [Pectobacterium carotovorum subsp. carotovorum]|nr:hypothetical protein Pcaca05_32410 [Pectobacterium carotovorum subsp. carotovorum]
MQSVEILFYRLQVASAMKILKDRPKKIEHACGFHQVLRQQLGSAAAGNRVAMTWHDELAFH